jgi:hypothetical protein
MEKWRCEMSGDDGFKCATKLNIHSKKFLSSSRNVVMSRAFLLRALRQEKSMKKVSLVLATLATIAVAAPTVASAEGFGFRIGPDRDYYHGDRYYDDGPRAEFYGPRRGWHRDWDRGDRVIIRRHHYWDD